MTTGRKTGELRNPGDPDRREIVEILMTAGFYRALATVLESTAVDPDPPRFVD